MRRGDRSRNSSGTATDDDHLLFAQRARLAGLHGVGQLAQTGQAPRDLERDAPQEPRPHQQVVVVEPLRKEEVRRAQHVGIIIDGQNDWPRHEVAP